MGRGEIDKGEDGDEEKYDKYQYAGTPVEFHDND
jgi:hypothetical protein